MRILYIRLLLALLATTSSGPCNAQESPRSVSATPWSIPSNDYIQSLLDERTRINGVGIVVGIITPDGRRTIASGKSGATDGRPLDGDTVFQIGSMTKMFTGLLLAEMSLRGEVDLNGFVVSYLPPGAAMREKMKTTTLTDLATHQSALPSMPTNFNPRAKPNPIEGYRVRQLFQFLADYEPSYAPGTQRRYSNVGVALLGRILANRTGKDYESLLKDRILDPLGMRDTVLSLSQEQRRRVAPGHDRFLEPVESWEMRTMPASGSLRSTANDLLKLMDHLGNTDSPLATAMQRQREIRKPAGGTQALGLMIRRAAGEEQFGHDGGKEGYRSILFYNVKRRTGIVVLTNARTEDAPANIALHIMSGRTIPPAPPAPEKPAQFKLTRQSLEVFAGRYRISENEALHIARRGDHLVVDAVGEGVGTYFPSGPNAFYSNTSDAEIVFDSQDGGNITGLSLREGSGTRRAVRVDERANRRAPP